MTYKNAMSFIEESLQYGSVLGLASIGQLLSRLDNPQNSLKFIHIAGTNGKGSTLAYISEILKEAGYKVGRYSSPSVFSYEEKFQINGKNITQKDFCSNLDRIKEKVLTITQEGLAHPTAFEIETALAFCYFKEQDCDFVVLETGLGGIEDATNIVTTTILSVITSISMDHKHILGNTLKEIAEKKAGIIKKGVPVVSVKQDREAETVIACESKNKNAPLTIADSRNAYDITYGLESQIFSYQEFKNLKIKLAGSYQIENAVLAVEAVTRLRQTGVSISDEAIRKGLLRTKWPGRFTCIRKNPLVILDGAHNADAATKLCKTVKEYFAGRRLLFIMGVLADKDYEKIAEIMSPLASHIITVSPPNNSRAMRSLDLANAVMAYNPNVTAADSVKDAVDMALLLAEKEDVILAFGSLSYLNNVKDVIGHIDKRSK